MGMATKSESKSSESKSIDPGPTRRSFLNLLWAVLAIVGLAEGLAVAIAFMRSRKVDPPGGEGDQSLFITAGKVADYAPDSVTAFPRGKFYLVRRTDGGFLALSRQCTHLGCTVPWDGDEQRFICPCHASAFDINGDILKSPAGRALDRYPLTIENNQLLVNTSRRIQRSGFQAEQVVYP